MGQIAFVFAGQGAQYPGMGRELCQASPAAAAVFQAADALRPGTSEQCFHGSEAELRETRNTQPCMYAVEMAAAAALGEKGIKAQMAAGFSVGELAALSYAGMADFETGFRLVTRRGELMQLCAEKTPTAMSAVLRLTNEEVERVCAEFPGVYPVNYNCPGQVAVAGAEEQMDAFTQAVKAAGGRAMPLPVRGGFHSPFMAEAADAFALELGKVTLAAPTVPLYSNCTGALYTEDRAGLLARQISSPVRWEQIIRAMIAAGADTFLELGPGHTLCGLIGKIDPTVRKFSVSDQNGLEAALAEVSAC